MDTSVIILDSESDDDAPFGILGQLKAERINSPERNPVQNTNENIPFPPPIHPNNSIEACPVLAIEPAHPVESSIQPTNEVVSQAIPSCPDLFNSDNDDIDDDDEPLEELVQRKVSSESNPERILTQPVENDDCEIVDNPPIRPNSPDSGEISEDVDEDLSVRVDQLAESFTLSHPRHSCPKFTKFQYTEIKNHIIKENEEFCPKCFCYLCEVE